MRKLSKHAATPLRRWPLAAALAIVLLLVFARLAAFDFVNYDDYDVAGRNPHVLGGLSSDGFRWAWTTLHHSNWHPLTWLSLQLDSTLFGTSAAGYHATNVALHVCAAVLLFAAFDKMSGRRWLSLLLACIYGLHPLHVQSVAWIGERKGALCNLFWMAALAAYAWYAAKPSLARYACLAAAFAAGLLSKQMIVTLPAALLLLDVWPLGRIGPLARSAGGATLAAERVGARFKAWRLALLEKLPLAALSAALVVVAYMAQSHGGALRSYDQFPIEVRAANAAVSYAQYLRKFVWPSDLAVFYAHPGAPSRWLLAGAIGVLLFGCAVSAIALRRRPYVFVGWWWFVGTLVPVIGLIQIGDHAMADRYMDIPLVGLGILAVWGGDEVLTWLVGRRPRLAPMRWLVPAALVAALAFGSAREVGFWRSSYARFTRDIEVAGDSEVARFALSAWASDQAQYELALEHANKGLTLAPKSWRLLDRASHALVEMGRPGDALPYIERALALHSTQPIMRIRLGLVHAQLGNYDAAAAEFLAVRDDAALGSTALFNLGVLRLKQQRPSEACDAFADSAALDAAAVQPRLARARVLAQLARRDEAIAAYEEVLRIDPRLAEAARELAYLRSRAR